jgi:RNA polymerase sigma-B factor
VVYGPSGFLSVEMRGRWTLKIFFSFEKDYLKPIAINEILKFLLGVSGIDANLFWKLSSIRQVTLHSETARHHGIGQGVLPSVPSASTKAIPLSDSYATARMKRDEFRLWTLCRWGDDEARKELVLLYLPLAMFWARQISRTAPWANLEDLKQYGVIGLIKAVERYDPSKGIKFKSFARKFICGAIFDSPEFTRDLARRQKEICVAVRQADAELTLEFQRIPTIQEIAARTGLTIQQILNANDALAVAAVTERLDPEAANFPLVPEPRRTDRTIMLLEALSRLTEREQEIIRLYYWSDCSAQEIAQKLGLTETNVTKIRQRVIKKLGKLLE